MASRTDLAMNRINTGMADTPAISDTASAIRNRFAQMAITDHNINVGGLLTEFADILSRMEDAPEEIRERITNLNTNVHTTFEPFNQRRNALLRTPNDNKPVIRFIQPQWTLEMLAQWKSDNRVDHPFNSHITHEPMKSGTVSIDSRQSRPADPIDLIASAREGMTIYQIQPQQAATPPQPERTDQHGVYHEARPARPLLLERRGWPEIITGAEFAYAGPNNMKDEENIIQYTNDDKRTKANLDMVRTLTNFEAFAKKVGYTHRHCLNFLRRLCHKKMGEHGYESFEHHTDPNEVAKKLIDIYYQPPPLNRIVEARNFSRLPTESIKQTKVRLQLLYETIYQYINNPNDRATMVENNTKKDILGLIHPKLATLMRQIRTDNILGGTPQPLDWELDVIDQQEQLKPGLKIKEEVFLRERDVDNIQGIECNTISLAPEENQNRYRYTCPIDATDNLIMEINNIQTLPQPQQGQPKPPTTNTIKEAWDKHQITEEQKKAFKDLQKLPAAPPDIQPDGVTGRKRYNSPGGTRKYSQSPYTRTVTRYEKRPDQFIATRVGAPGTEGTKPAPKQPPTDRSNTQPPPNKTTQPGQNLTQTQQQTGQQQTYNRQTMDGWKRSESGNTFYRDRQKKEYDTKQIQKQQPTHRRQTQSPQRDTYDRRRSQSPKEYTRRRQSTSPNRTYNRFSSTNRPSRTTSRPSYRQDGYFPINNRNISYWRDKVCKHCNEKDHGETTCAKATCGKCNLLGVHTTPDMCDRARRSLNAVMIAFDQGPSRGTSTQRQPRMEINTAELQEMLEDIMAKAVQKTGIDSPKNE